MDPTVAAPTLGGLGGLPPPGVDEVVTTGYAGDRSASRCRRPRRATSASAPWARRTTRPCRRARQAWAACRWGRPRRGMQPPPSAFGPTSLSEAVSHRLDARGPCARSPSSRRPRPTPSRSASSRPARPSQPQRLRAPRGQQRAAPRHASAAYGQPGGAYGGAAAGQLDQNALSAAGAPQEQATSILGDELASRAPACATRRRLRRQGSGSARPVGRRWPLLRRPARRPAAGLGGRSAAAALTPPMHGQPPAPAATARRSSPSAPRASSSTTPAGTTTSTMRRRRRRSPSTRTRRSLPNMRTSIRRLWRPTEPCRRSSPPKFFWS